MILYKYVSFETGLKILETNTLGFTLPSDFNDPFEVSALGLRGENIGVSGDTKAARNRFVGKYAVLSLTREPLNPLMWSHYADSHKGMVIGIDTQKAGLEDVEKYTIPAHRGEMIYIKTAPRKINSLDYSLLMKIGTSEFTWDDQERLLKQAFLYKGLHWAYEEEVRVVKCVSDKYNPYNFQKDEITDIGGDTWVKKALPFAGLIFLKKIPTKAFVEVYIGVNCIVDQLRNNHDRSNLTQTSNVSKLKELCLANEIGLYSVSANLESWSLESKQIELT